MVLVAKGISAKDDRDPSPTLSVAVASNEPVNGLGDGDMAPDWNVVNNGNGTFDVWVRAERSGKGSGRIYTITATATDRSNNTASVSAAVTVGHDQGKKAAKMALSGLEEVPESFGIDPNYPNPFNPATTIRYALPEASDVRLVVYNILGQQVRALAQGRQEAGYYRVTWDGRDDAGRPVSSGLYLYRFESKGLVKTEKMLLLK
ncbi:MAG: hypothetical protein A3F84_12920 [Candidatus Handelsmanbacteria bacterium RIFCSPLOWO2_12_FULL_64_10]|uniref:FlgD/Vpr Ig-like domain-containing protein n=1 Tax=Handelsmanbacteria sp. (strain RIFCSPLOWO2_12_FULL_64_10) TaxID=1817868 RepID=A0A1F6C263_HANXR|nr:MAG: hypothetical protein A3F84_12920 [Candidatus Handelsmanbacteria bacterium RIFCSPLOWO2_12_FULL_64_10]